MPSSIPTVLFNAFRKSTDLDNEKKDGLKVSYQIDRLGWHLKSWKHLNLTYYVVAKYDFNSLKGWNALFSDFRKSTDLDNEKKDGLLRKIYRNKWIIRLIGLVGTSRAENI